MELQGWNAELVSRLLVTLLHGKDLLLEFLMECFQVHDKSLGMGGGEVLVRVDGYARVVAFISIKWRNSSCLTWGIVVSKFRKWEKFGPIILLMIAIGLEMLLQGLIHPFGLTICLWMMSGCEMEGHVKHFPRDWKKCETNSGPQPEVTCEGTLCLEK